MKLISAKKDGRQSPPYRSFSARGRGVETGHIFTLAAALLKDGVWDKTAGRRRSSERQVAPKPVIRGAMYAHSPKSGLGDEYEPAGAGVALVEMLRCSPPADFFG